MSIRPISFDPLVDPVVVPGTEGWLDIVPSALAMDYAMVNLHSTFVPGDWPSQLESLDASVVAIYPPRSYVFRLPAENEPLLEEIPLVRWAEGYLPGYRVPPEVSDACPPAGLFLDLWLVLFKGEDPDAYLGDLMTQVPGIVIVEVQEPGADMPWSSARIGVSVPAAALPAALEILAGFEAVELFELRVPAQPANDAVISWLQGGEDDDAAPEDYDPIPPATLGTAPAFSAGITGLGETIAVADSGLENDMSYFRWTPRFDPSGIATGVESTAPGIVDSAKKVVGYFWFDHSGPRYDDCQGQHGTGMAGIAAGDAFNDAAGIRDYFLATDDDPTMEDEPVGSRDVLFAHFIDHHQEGDGHAPGAQILVQDIADDTCAWHGDPARLLPQAYFSTDTSGTLDIRHSTNSWGSPDSTSSYSFWSSILDGFAWLHRDMNIYFCAGNEGPGPGTLRDPSRAKNCTTVGNSGHPDRDFESGSPPDPNTGGDFGWSMYQGSSHGPAATLRLKPDLSVPGVLVNTADPACPSPVRPGAPTGVCPPTGTEPGTETTVIACTDSADNDSDGLIDCADTGCCHHRFCPPCPPNYEASDPSSLQTTTGTSPATAAVAGLSALLRQYIREGRYPDGLTTHPGNGFSPSSALIKALLINSTRDVWDEGHPGTGWYTADSGSGRKHRPSLGQGWGRPVLDDIIDFGPTDNPGDRAHERPGLFIATDTPNGLITTDTYDGRPAALPSFRKGILPGEIHEFAFEVTDATKDLHVTLAWAGWKASSQAVVPLVNDLDLELIDPDGFVWRTEPHTGFGGPWERCLWAGGYSRLKVPTGPPPGADWEHEYLTPQADAPPFLEFETRDERNNVENVFIRAFDPANPDAPDRLKDGSWRARVIYKAAASSPDINPDDPLDPLDAFDVAYPDLVDDGCIDASLRPCDGVVKDHQGYALVVSGAAEQREGYLGFRIVDGCSPCPKDQLVDLREFVTMEVSFFYGGRKMPNVTAEFFTTDPGVTFDVRSLDGNTTVDPGNTRRCSMGDLGPGFHVARAMWAWNPAPPSPCISAAGLPFTVKLVSNGLQFEEYSFTMDRGDTDDCCDGTAGGSWPTQHPEPVPATALAGNLQVSLDPTHACCGGSGQESVIFTWSPIPGANRYNLYRGTLADLAAGHFDHVAHQDPFDPLENVGFCNLGPIFLDACPPFDGRPDFCDADEPGSASFYYLLTGEGDCIVGPLPPWDPFPILRGKEGSTGSGAGGEYPLGTGCE